MSKLDFEVFDKGNSERPKGIPDELHYGKELARIRGDTIGMYYAIQWA